MAKTKTTQGGRVLRFLRLESRESIKKTLLGTVTGILSYLILYLIVLPSFKVMGLLTVQINLALLAIPVAAGFFGPLAGLLVGLFGTLGTDILFNQQIIALGVIDLSYGLLGFIAGIPRYTQGEGFSNGRTLGKFLLFTMAGFAVMVMVYLAGLILVAGQNILSALLYSFLPFFSVSLLTLLIVSPVAVRLVDIVASYSKKRLS
nr:hypothetical protein [Candidatus Njordarchaeota archaeon]